MPLNFMGLLLGFFFLESISILIHIENNSISLGTVKMNSKILNAIIAKVLLFVNPDFHWGGYFFNDRYLTLHKEIQKNITERHAVNYDNKKK